MWEDFWVYYPYIKKVSRRWIKRFKNKDYELEDLYHEGVLIYHKIYTCYQRLPYENFIKVLTKSCQNHFISLLRKNTIRTEYFGSMDTYSFTIPSLWTRSYFVATAGNVSQETIKKYIEVKKIYDINL